MFFLFLKKRQKCALMRMLSREKFCFEATWNLGTPGVWMVVIKHLSNGPWLGLAFTQASQEKCRQTHHHHTAFQRCLCNLIWKG